MGGRVSPRRATLFSCSHKKRRQKKCAPLSVTPSLCCGAACDARERGAAAELTSRLWRFVQTAAASQSTMRGHAALPTRTPPAALLGTDRGDGGDDSGHCFARPWEPSPLPSPRGRGRKTGGDSSGCPQPSFGLGLSKTCAAPGAFGVGQAQREREVKLRRRAASTGLRA